MSKHRAHAQWKGPLPTGTGTMQLGASGPVIGYTLNARVMEEAGTNPEQMVGAAHAGCFAMSLSNLIEETGQEMSGVTVDADALVHLNRKDDGFWIDRIDLICRGVVPGMSEETFVSLAEKAKATCPVSKLYATADITLDAALAQ